MTEKDRKTETYFTTKKMAFIFILIQSAGLLAISFFSTYVLPNYQGLNLKIATMMTPSGILTNYFLDPYSELKVYYNLEPTGNIELSHSTFFMISLLFIFLVVNFYSSINTILDLKKEGEL